MALKHSYWSVRQESLTQCVCVRKRKHLKERLYVDTDQSQHCKSLTGEVNMDYLITVSPVKGWDILGSK